MTIHHEHGRSDSGACSAADASSGEKEVQGQTLLSDEPRSFIHHTLILLNKHLVSLARGVSAGGEKEARSDVETVKLGEENYRLFRQRVEELQEEIKSPENQKLIATTDHALATIACFAERIHKNGYRALQSEEMSHSFMLASIHTLSEQLVSQLFPRVQELQSQYAEVVTLPPIKNPQPIAFIPPAPEKLVKKFQSTELEKRATLKDAQALGDRSILSPIEEFLAPYQRTLNRIDIAATIGTIGALAYLRPELKVMATAAVIVTAYHVLKAIVQHYGGRYFSHWREQVVSRQAQEQNPCNTGLMDMPERRQINLGRSPRERPNDRGVDATDISKTGSKAVTGSHAGRVQYCSISFRERLGVTASYVISSNDGKVGRFDAFCREVDDRTPEAMSMLETWFPLRSVPDAARLEHHYGEARIEFSTKPGDRTFPLPVGHRIAGISLRDRNGAEVVVDGGFQIREGRLGGFSIHIPEEVSCIEYVVEKDEGNIPPEAIQRLWEVMPKYPCFVPEHQQYLAERMRAFASSPEDLARLDYVALIESRLTYTMDPFVIALQERSKSALSETLLGMRMGICDSFAYTVARRMNTLSLPALTVAGLVTERNDDGELVFNFKEGHAQAVLPTERGPLIFDATLHAAPDTINSSSLGWHERAEALLSISQGTYRDAYQKARHLGERLRGEVRKEDSAIGWFSPLYRIWYLGLVPTNADSSRMSQPPRGLSEDVRIDESERLLARALMIKSFDDGLKNALQEGLASGSFHGVYRYLENKLTVRISKFRREILPEELQSLTDYNPIREGIAYTNSAILEGRLDEAAIGESFDWILSTFPSARRDLPNSQDNDNNWHLDLKEAAQYSDEAYLSRMTPDQQVRFSRATTSLIINTLFAGRNRSADVLEIFSEMDRSEVSELVKHCDPSALGCGVAALNVFLRAGRDALSREPEMSIQAFYKTVTRLTAGVGRLLEYEYSERPFEELRYQYEQLTMARATLLNALPDWGETLSTPLLGNDSSHIFPDTTGHPEIPCLGSLLTSPVAEISATTYFERKIISRFLSNYIDTFDYSYVLERCRSLGFPEFSLVPYQESIERMVLEQARRIPESERCNLPGRDSPISQLVHDLCDTDAGAVLRLATSLKEQGGISDSIAEKWPRVDERLVSNRSERYFLVTQDLELCGLPRYTSAPIRMSGYPEYLELLMPSDSPGRECLRYLVGSGVRPRQPENAAVAALSFPAFADHVRHSHQPSPLFFEKLVAASLTRSLESRAQYYHLLLGRSVWEQSDENNGSSQQKLSRFLKEYDSDALTGDMRSEKANAFLSGFPKEIRGLPSLSDRSKIEFILLCYLSESDRSTFESLAGRKLPYELDECFKGYKTKTLPEIWPQQISQCTPCNVSVEAAWQRSQTWVADHTGLRAFHAPYQRFLQHATGLVIAKGISGEFTDYREYRQGDDLRLIDHKASARLGKTLVRLLAEREAHHINLVYDADLLWEGESWKSGDSVNEAMVDLFTHLHLAELQGVNLDLWICHRGGVSRLPNLVRTRNSGAQSRYTTAEFREELSETLSGYFGLRGFEDEWLEDPVYEQNLLAHCGDKLLGDRILVCRIDEDNMDANLPMLSFLRKKGAKIAVVRSNISELSAVNDGDFA
jgi:hypothetical protein